VFFAGVEKLLEGLMRAAKGDKEDLLVADVAEDGEVLLAFADGVIIDSDGGDPAPTTVNPR
jgi:hypothetical protein